MPSESVNVRLVDYNRPKAGQISHSIDESMIIFGDGADIEFKVAGDGDVTADGSFTGSGADYAEFFEWDRKEREYTMYLRYTDHDVRNSKVLTSADIGKEFRAPNGRRQKNSNGYWKWGQTQDSSKNIEERKKHIEKFVNENIDLWLKKGYLA